MSFKKMTILIAGAVGASMAAYADPPTRGNGHQLPPGLAKQGKIPPGHAKKIWGKGQYLPVDYRDVYLADWNRYDLRDAPRGYRWVLVEDRDAYLVDLTSGLIADVVIDLLN
jgi:hypothetical protein